MQSEDILALGIILAALVVGIILGFIIAKIRIKREQKLLEKNAREVLEGKRENILEIDGKKYDASRFKLRDENDEEYIVDLKGGGQIQDAKKEKVRGKKDYKLKDLPPLPKKNSRSPGKKKRASRARNGRIRRFG